MGSTGADGVLATRATFFCDHYAYSSEPCIQMNDCKSIMSRGRKSRPSRRTSWAKSKRPR